ncbi:protein of unknown function DUF935 [Candidatus Magnetoovum chiemensis]|nr:protein of unknown function DUF935 [Candidatus Magnetoovum chiemensis]
MPLLDRYGRQIKSQKPIVDEIAIQDLYSRYSTYPSQGLTPSALAAISKEADSGDISRQAELFDELEEKDGHLGSALQTRKLAAAGLVWEILPASASREDKKIASAAQEMLNYIEDIDLSMLDILDAVGKGFSVQEIMWEISEGQVWIKRLKDIRQKQFTFMSKDAVSETPKLITKESRVYGEELIPTKFVVYRHKARSGAVCRGGLIRPCTYLYLFKNYSIKDWVIFNELYAVPMRIGKYRAGTNKEEVEVLKQAVFNLSVDAAAVISDNTVIELLEAQARGETSAFRDLIEFCDKSMSKVVLGHTGSSESTPGKLGSEDQAKEVRQDLLELDARSLMRVIKFQILQPWVIFNYGADKGIPKFILHYEAAEDLEKTSRIYKTLVEAGFDGIPKKHVHEQFGIPEAQEGEETLKAARSTPSPAAGDSPLANSAIIANKSIAEHPVDLIVTRLENDNAVSTFLSPVVKLIESASSLEELQEKIISAYKDLDAAALGNIIQKALAAAEIYGRSEVEDGSAV